MKNSLLVYYQPFRVHSFALQSEGRIILIIITFIEFRVYLHFYYNMTLGHNSLGWVMVLFYSTYPCFKKVFIYLRMLALMLVAFGIWHVGCSMYHIYIQLCFCFHEYCLLVIIISPIWDVTIILCFHGAMLAHHYPHWHFLPLMELPSWINIIYVDMCIPTFGCAVPLNLGM